MAASQAAPRAILLIGPTASGKSRVAMELAQRLHVEIVSVDSAQVYAGMDIGTAKPTAGERGMVRHHLIDIVPPDEVYSAARFREDATRLLGEIRSRGRLPLLVGGTMLYFKVLLEGLSSLPQADPAVRAAIDLEARTLGWPAMHSRLAEVDPATAQRLKPADSQRIQRALEVFRITGQPMAKLLEQRRDAGPGDAYLPISLVPGDRALLHKNIEARFHEMLRRGLVEELAGLRQSFLLSPDLPSMRAVGYRQAWQYLEGELNGEELKHRGVFATRQLAKRQMTWLRSWRDAVQLDCNHPRLSQRVYETVRQASGL